MVELQGESLDAIFHALSDGTRRAMLAKLADGGPRTIGDLARPFDMSFAGASKHVKVLERAGLVSREIRGRTHHCRLDAERLREADQWMARYRRFWTSRLDTLEALLNAADKEETSDGHQG